MSNPLSAKVGQAHAAAGTSRHYRGPGLGTPPPWECQQCGATWTTEPADGCLTCRQAAEAALAQRAEEQMQAKMQADLARPVLQPAPRVSPLLQPKPAALPVEALLERIEAVVERTVEAVAQKYLAPAATPVLNDTAPYRYAIYIGMQLLLQMLLDQGEGVDPLMLSTADVQKLLEDLEADPILQAYLTAAPPAAPAAEGDRTS